MQFQLPGAAATDPDQMGLFDADDVEPGADPDQTHVGFSLATIDSRVATGEQSTEDPDPHTQAHGRPGGVQIPLFLPMVTTRWERDPFSLASINLTDVEAWVASSPRTTRPRSSARQIDAERDAAGRAHVVIHDATYTVAASQVAMPYGDIETDLVRRLLSTNGIVMNAVEQNAARRHRASLHGGRRSHRRNPVAGRARPPRHYPAGGVDQHQADLQPGPRGQGSHPRQVARPARASPRPAPRLTGTSSPSPSEFTRHYPYEGWAKSVYEINSFDAYSTEFLLACHLRDPRRGPGVAPDRPHRSAAHPLPRVRHPAAVRCPTSSSSTHQGTYWIVEGKADGEMTSNTVLAKRDAAREWVKTVNASDTVHDKWGYLLASEAVIASSTTWAALKNGGQAYQ